MNHKVKPISVAVGAVMTIGLTAAAFAIDTEEDPFALEAAGEGYDLLAGDHEGEGECGEGKCGDEGGDDDGGDDDGGDDDEGGDDEEEG